MKRFAVSIFVVIALLGAVGVTYAVSADTQAVIAGEQHLPAVIDQLKSGGEWNIANTKSLDRATLGSPIPRYILDNDFDSGRPLWDQMTQDMTFYNYPVLVDGRPVAEFQLSLDSNGKWDNLMVGGDLPLKLESHRHDIGRAVGDIDEIRIVNALGGTWIYARSKTSEAAFKPYGGADFELGISDDVVYKNAQLRGVFERERNWIKEKAKNPPVYANDEDIPHTGGFEPHFEAYPRKSNMGSVTHRLQVFGRHYLHL